MSTKKSEILKAASECFMTYGYNKTSMSDIGRMVGLNKASLYYHYKDKLSIYKEVVSMYRKDHFLRLEEMLSGISDHHQKLLTFIHAEVGFAHATSAIFPADPAEVARTKSEIGEVHDQVLEADVLYMEKIIRQGMEAGVFIPCNAKRVATMILDLALALLNKSCPLYLMPSERDAGYEQVKDDVTFATDLILAGLKQPQ